MTGEDVELVAGSSPPFEERVLDIMAPETSETVLERRRDRGESWTGGRVAQRASVRNGVAASERPRESTQPVAQANLRFGDERNCGILIEQGCDAEDWSIPFPASSARGRGQETR